MKLKSKLCSSLAKIMPAVEPDGNYRRAKALLILRKKIYSMLKKYAVTG